MLLCFPIRTGTENSPTLLVDSSYISSFFIVDTEAQNFLNQYSEAFALVRQEPLDLIVLSERNMKTFFLCRCP